MVDQTRHESRGRGRSPAVIGSAARASQGDPIRMCLRRGYSPSLRPRRGAPDRLALRTLWPLTACCIRLLPPRHQPSCWDKPVPLFWVLLLGCLNHEPLELCPLCLQTTDTNSHR